MNEVYWLLIGGIVGLLLGLGLIVKEILSPREKGQTGLNSSAYFWIQVVSSIVFGLLFLGFFVKEALL